MLSGISSIVVFLFISSSSSLVLLESLYQVIIFFIDIVNIMRDTNKIIKIMILEYFSFHIINPLYVLFMSLFVCD